MTSVDFNPNMKQLGELNEVFYVRKLSFTVSEGYIDPVYARL